MNIHTPESVRRTRQLLNRKRRRGEDLRARVEIALNIMHEGHVLRLHLDRRWGPSWVLSPGNWPVAEEVARALIAELDVIACGDGLFGADGPSQTYRLADGDD